MEQTSTAVVFESPGELSLRDVTLPPCGPEDCVVAVEWTGISTGTERLLWDGRMPHFPGLDYPLVPGYETVGRVVACGDQAFVKPGSRVFVPGSRGFTDVHGIFGGAAQQLVVSAKRVVPVPATLGEEAVLLALAATAVHALNRLTTAPTSPLLVVGHGVLGRLLARVAVARGLANINVWETQAARRQPVQGYQLIDPSEDEAGRYGTIIDATGDVGLLDQLIARLLPSGTLLLAGFYHQPIRFDFPPAFMRELSLLIAAEWHPTDMHEALDLLADDALSLEGLITHRYAARDAAQAYAQAFSDAECLKLILDWRHA